MDLLKPTVEERLAPELVQGWVAIEVEDSGVADVGPVDLREVQLVLDKRLLEVAVPPAKARYGKVFVAPLEQVIRIRTGETGEEAI